MIRQRQNNPELSVAAQIRIIASVALRYWRRLPLHVRSWYDVEDMINDCVAQVVDAMPRYRANLAGKSTFVHTVAVNCCRQTVERMAQKKRKAVAVLNLEDAAQTHMVAHHRYASPETYCRGKEAAERVMQCASDDLRRAVVDVLAGRHVPKHTVLKIREEAKELLRRNSIGSQEVITYLMSGGM